MPHRLAFLLAAIPIAACTSDLEPEVCPSVGVGDLVVTEVRGNQSGTYGEWIELWNAGGGAIDLRGLRVGLRELDGANPDLLIVRRSTTVAAGDFHLVPACADGVGGACWRVVADAARCPVGGHHYLAIDRPTAASAGATMTATCTMEP